MALNMKQELFCQEFINCKYNAAKAYERVYNPPYKKGIYCSSTQLMKNPEVKARISELEREIFEANRINAEHIANELATMAFGDVGEETGISHQTKLKALDLLQKQAGLQTQNIKADVNQDIVIQIKGEKPDEGT